MDNLENHSALKFRPSLFRWSFVFVICSAVSVIGLIMINSGESKGWFVFAAILGSLMAPLHYFNSYLELDKNGYRVRMLWRSSERSWDQVKDFDVVTVGFNSMVSFRSGMGMGAEMVLPDTFGMKPQDLAGLMNKYQKAYIKR